MAMTDVAPPGPMSDLLMERAVLDACLSAPGQLAAVRTFLDPRAFYWTQHRTIYRAALTLADSGQEPDILTVQAELDRASPPKHGEPWALTLANLHDAAPVWGNAPRYAARVAELAELRRVSQVASLLASAPDDEGLRLQVVEAMTRTRISRIRTAPAEAFLAEQETTPPALVGTAEDCLLPAGGLLIEFAKGGRGKTTLTLDFALHAVSAVEWLTFPIPRPLNVLFLENEGPRAMFRAKLAQRMEGWEHEIRGALHVLTEPWGQFTFADPGLVAELRAVIATEEIDLVIGDPLDTFGLSGAGSPEDTRAFLTLLQRAGLGRDAAFMLLHHSRKEPTEDEQDEASGAWGPRPDTMLRLARLPGNRARLSFPKVRWSRMGERQPFILDFDPTTEAFSILAIESPPAFDIEEVRDVLAELREALADGSWRSVNDLKAPRARGGIGARHELVQELLEDHPELFVSAPGKLVGRPHTPTLWKALNVDDATVTGAP